MDDLVERMHQLLADALRRARSDDPFGAPVTVAEIYQDLVPYRAVRAQLGFEMNADYEHTLLRLLAGEGERARLDPPEAREELQAELDSPNPNVGLFRKFAACDVWVRPVAAGQPREPAPEAVASDESWDGHRLDWVRGIADPDTEYADESGLAGSATSVPPQAGWTEEHAETELLLEDAIDLAADDETTLFPEVEAPAGTSSSNALPGGQMKAGASPDVVTAAPGAAAGQCAFCDSTLPSGRTVRFCPYCGADQSMVPCAACGEALEQSWNYCIACGARAAPVTA